ncbi:hypothetical protein AYR66_07615 [Noviherbaspirillum denitrificans]|uniref:ParB-like N-terminal domain-containing protein n=2 Tax=Noviherbaspirillum denitrificans TaxID=1968433 RepID=A0A254TB70_9BURK|nr:hypothetical protein AYR66_01130 [Noviherbaspirillum denitrificans]OWW19397.1 hypothetical protein AYR66_07615 [Noviherbaspirillum denitrificans]
MTATQTNFAEPHFGTIPLACVIPSKTNPRKHFDESALHELAESIRQVGVAQPILVRPLPTTESMIDCVEIVAGERRYRASKLAGLQSIPAIVRELTDVQVLEIQVIENLQRQDVHPIEEAEGYDQLMRQHDYTAEQLADKVGKSKAYIYGRLKLCSLASEAREAFFAGKINASIAERIARMPVLALQAKATQEIVHNYGQPEPMSFRRAVEHLQARYMLDLAHAKFAIKDAKLVSATGSCLSCPKRTGNQPEIYHDVDADVCTDPDCFESKVNAHNERKAAAAQKSGLPIYADGMEAYTKLRENNQVSAYDGLYKMDRLAKSSMSNTPIEDVIPADQLPKPVAYVKGNDGEIDAVYEKSAIQFALEKAGLCLTLEKHNALLQEKMSGNARDPKVSEKEKQAEAERRERTKKAELETTIRKAVYAEVRSKILQGDGHLTALRHIAKRLCDEWSFPHVIASDYKFNVLNFNEAAKFIDSASLEEVVAFILGMTIGECVQVDAFDMDDDEHLENPWYLGLLDVAKACDIEHDKIRSEHTPKPAEQQDLPVAAETPKKKGQQKTAETAAEAPKMAETTKDATDTKKAAPAKPTPAKKAAATNAKTDEVPATAWPFPTAAEMAAKGK